MNGNYNFFRPKGPNPKANNYRAVFVLPVLDMTSKGVLFQFMGTMIQVPRDQFVANWRGIQEGSN